MRTLFKIFQTPSELAEDFAAELAGSIRIASEQGAQFNLAVSGGNTPKLLFSILAEKYCSSIHWSHVHLFWVDERCVPPGDPESNYGMTKQILLDHISIPERNVHRMRGEDDPEKEAGRYSGELQVHVKSKNKLPEFDLMILGMGDDGHTASIFPGSPDLFKSDKICDVTVHPASGQKRITLTGKVINNSDSVAFLVTGRKKAGIIEDIYKKKPQYMNYPASSVSLSHGPVIWFLDEEAAGLII